MLGCDERRLKISTSCPVEACSFSCEPDPFLAVMSLKVATSKDEIDDALVVSPIPMLEFVGRYGIPRQQSTFSASLLSEPLAKKIVGGIILCQNFVRPRRKAFDCDIYRLNHHGYT